VKGPAPDPTDGLAVVALALIAAGACIVRWACRLGGAR
jgi:hypothetical protein